MIHEKIFVTSLKLPSKVTRKTIEMLIEDATWWRYRRSFSFQKRKVRRSEFSSFISCRKAVLLYFFSSLYLCANSLLHQLLRDSLIQSEMNFEQLVLIQSPLRLVILFAFMEPIVPIFLTIAWNPFFNFHRVLSFCYVQN